MSLLPWWELDWADLDYEWDHPDPTPEILTVTAGRVWWSETTVLPDLD